ncbi:terminase TerL endonuclease subunit [Streptomyces stramineus]
MEFGAKGILYDCREAVRDIDLKDESAVRAGVIDAYGDSHWVDVDGIVAAVMDPRTSAAVAYRFYLNNIQENADGWLVKTEWDACFDDGDDPILPGDQIAIGFDGSIRGDSTAIVGARLRDGKLFMLGLWENPGTPNSLIGKLMFWRSRLPLSAPLRRTASSGCMPIRPTGRRPLAGGLSSTGMTAYTSTGLTNQ